MESVLRQPELEQEPSSVRRPMLPSKTRQQTTEPKLRRSFPKDLLDREEGSKFVDPAKEAMLLLPEQTIASVQLVLDVATAPNYSMKERREGTFSSIYEYLLSVFELFKKKLKGTKRRKARLTKKGEETLAQLKYLSQLCDATTCRTPEEILEAEGAFGEAYYEIMSLSANLEKMSQSEQHHHIHRYSSHMARLLESD